MHVVTTLTRNEKQSFFYIVFNLKEKRTQCHLMAQKRIVTSYG